MRSGKFLFIFFAVLMVRSTIPSGAQVKVTDGSDLAMNPNSLLELESTSKGLLIPRMAINNLNQTAPLTAPVPAGMLVYSISGSVPDGFYYWTGTIWKKFVQSPVAVNEGGTGSTTQNWVDLTTNQTVAGAKTWSNPGTFNAGITVSSAAVSLNNNSNFATNINTGTSTGTVNIGGSSNSVYLPKFTSAGVVHNSAAGLLSSSLIVNDDITNGTINLTTKVTGTLPVANGGTGLTTFGGNNTILFTSAANALTYVPASTAAGQFLQTTASGGAPSWKTILGVANGGTGLSGGTSGGVLAFTGTGTIASSAELTQNSLVLGGGAGATPSVLNRGSTYQVVAVNSDGTKYTHRAIKQLLGTWGYKDLATRLTNKELQMVALGGTSMSISGSKMRMPFAGRIIGIIISSSAAFTGGTATFTVFKNNSSTTVTATISSSGDTQYTTSTTGSESFINGDLLDLRVTTGALLAPNKPEIVGWIIIEWTE